MGKDYRPLANDIVAAVGGPENVNEVIHCITRLRFYLKDETKADSEAIREMPGVAGAVYNEQLGQYQVVIGHEVADVYDEVTKILGQTDVEETTTTQAPKPTTMLGWVSHGFKLLIATITGSMMPVIGLLAASGILKGFLTLFTFNFHLIDTDSATYTIINAMGDAAFYFLPILVGFSAAKQLKSDPITVAAIAGVLVHPTIAELWSAPTKGMTELFGVPLNADFFGLPIHIPQYTYSIFPIIFGAWLARPVDNWFKKVLPVSLRSIFQPLFTVFIVTAVILCVMGPVISLISAGMAWLIHLLVTANEAVAGLIIGGLYQCLVIFGLHWMVIPLLSNDLATTGHSVLNGLINFSMIAQAAGALAVFVKSKQANIKGLGLAGALSGFAGVTEPAVYGINLKYGRVFWMANIGGAVGGFIAGLMKIDMWGFTGSLIGFPSFINPNTGIDMSFWAFWAGSAATIAVSFLCVYFWGFKDSDTEVAKTAEKKNVSKTAQGA